MIGICLTSSAISKFLHSEWLLKTYIFYSGKKLTRDIKIDKKKFYSYIKGKQMIGRNVGPRKTESADIIESIKFLGVMITDNLSWTSHVDETVKKAQQHLFFLRKFDLSVRTLTNLYRHTIESILSRCVTDVY
eukprot:g45937.t1